MKFYALRAAITSALVATVLLYGAVEALHSVVVTPQQMADASAAK